MALTKIQTGGITDDAITSAKMVDGAIVNADINASAAIAQSKLSLDITNSDINASAAIVQSKLSLDITNSDINASAAIAQSKLSLDVTNSDVNASAAIAQSKLATLAITDSEVADNALSGNKIDGGVISNFASTGIDDNSNAACITIDSSERVGIGTTSPQKRLHLKNAGGGVYFRIEDGINPYIYDIAVENGVVDGLLVADPGVAWILTLTRAGNLTIAGALSKGSGSFRIDHPLPEKKDSHWLVHSFVESPRADLIYRDKIDLVDGSATVNIDTVAGMTEGTFVLLCDDIQCFTSNESDWDAVKGSVSGNILTIECQNTSSTATIAWMVIGDRKDEHMKSEGTDWTDANGKPIIEPEKTSADTAIPPA